MLRHARVPLVSVVSLLLGCAYEIPEPGTAAGEWLTRTGVESVGAACPHGGFVVESGPDADLDGHLADAEVATTELLCADAPYQVMSSTTAEEAGENCPAGGEAVSSGLDEDRDGVLDPEEVLSTEYVCREAWLTEVVPLAGGVDCAAGGQSVRTGVDADRDGVLDESEIESTEHVCDQVLDGDWTIRSEQDLAALAAVRVIHGSLSHQADKAIPLNLPTLEIVSGHIGAVGVAAISLPALQRVGTAWLSVAPGGPGVDLSSLQQAALLTIQRGGSPRLGALKSVKQLRMGWFDAGARVDLPVLTTADLIQVGLSSEQLVAFSAPELTFATQLSFDQATFLTEIELPKLQEVHTFYLGITAVETLRLPALRTVTYELFINGALTRVLELPSLVDIHRLELCWLENLERVSAPKLYSADLIDVKDAFLLNELSVPALRDLAQLSVSRAPEWARCQIDRIVASLTTSASVGISGVDEDAICSP